MVGLLLAAGGAPTLAMLPNPVEEGTFETDIITQPLRLEPFVLQDFFPLREEFLIETGLFHKLAGRRRLLSRMSHAAG